jgi:SOS response associated peptidase (SRAP)
VLFACESPHWRAWLNVAHRCVVPFNSFCEYADTKPRKTPTWFALDEDRPLAFFAGIWTSWHGKRGTKANPVEGEHQLFGFLTTDANAEVGAIHPKAMPVILTSTEAVEHWLTLPVKEEALRLSSFGFTAALLRKRRNCARQAASRPDAFGDHVIPGFGAVPRGDGNSAIKIAKFPSRRDTVTSRLQARGELRCRGSSSQGVTLRSWQSKWCWVRRCPEGPRHLGLKPVSADIRTSLCSRAEIPPGKSLARPETGAAFFVTPSDSGRQRPRHAASPTAKPRKIKDYSDDARKPELRRTAWWSWQDSKQPPSDYDGTVAGSCIWWHEIDVTAVATKVRFM